LFHDRTTTKQRYRGKTYISIGNFRSHRFSV
jgi:hypothetical protein